MSTPLQTVCPSCRAVNRVLPERMDQRPTCGKCHAPLLPGAVLPLDQAGFEAFLSRGSLPLLVKFWAPWCGPCRSSAPAFEQAAAELAPGLVAATVNTEEQQALASRLGIQAVPTMVLFAAGREKARISGALPAREVVNWARGKI